MRARTCQLASGSGGLFGLFALVATAVQIVKGKVILGKVMTYKVCLSLSIS